MTTVAGALKLCQTHSWLLVKGTKFLSKPVICPYTSSSGFMNRICSYRQPNPFQPKLSTPWMIGQYTP
ncbi:hypothetical protein Avbf_16718 [Armadillidium vulgare]|nr:hypothetical protein Avbf_16718 [Armadillidium vulgare]